MAITRFLGSRPWLMAGIALAAVVVWFLSGGAEEDAVATAGIASGESLSPVRVQVREQRAAPVQRQVSVYGRTTPARSVEIKAETSGRVVALGSPRGKSARGGDLLLRLDLRDREARLREAEANVRQHEAAWEAQRALKSSGYVSDTQLAETFAQLESARAERLRARLDLERMALRAPFDGTLLERHVEIGDFIREGDPVATFVDHTTLVVSGSIAEQDAVHVRVGMPALARLITGTEARGHIRYLAPVADEATRTFAVELEVPNPGGALPAGVTAEMVIEAGAQLAQRVSPSLLTLGSDGQVGVSVVDDDNRVFFHPVEIIRSSGNGVWVSGLPELARIIVVGQGYVAAGQVVDAVAAGPVETALAGRSP